MPWSVEDALTQLWAGLDTSGISGEIRPYFQKHLAAAFNAGRNHEVNAKRATGRSKVDNQLTEIEKRLIQLKRIVGHDSYIDATIRPGQPDHQVIYGAEAKRALAEMDQLQGTSHCSRLRHLW